MNKNAEGQSQTCDLCGLPSRYGTVTSVFTGKTYAFCCIGCRQVFTILMEATDSPHPETFRETDLYKQCQTQGIIPRSEEELTAAHFDSGSGADRTQSNAAMRAATSAGDNVLTLKLIIKNMWCSACAWVIDESLKKTPGIVDSSCNFSTDRLQVVYDPVTLSPDQIIDTIGKLGYRASRPGESEQKTDRRREFVRFAVSAFLTMNVMMLSFALYTGFFTDLSPENAAKLSWPMFIMATAILIYGGYDFYKKAWAGLRNAAFGMETLIIIGALSAYFYSTYNLFSASIHLYYDTAAMLITLVLLGKTLERRAKGKVLADLENFYALMPTKVRICTDHFPEGRYVALGQLAAGDIFRITETELAPADGRIVSGSGSVEESSLTGEPLPITKRPGDFIRSGARVQQGSFKIKAEKVGSDATLGQMMQIVEKTLLTKMPIEGKTDIILQWFVPVILMLAAATAIVCRLIGLTLETSILRAVTVMVISCPCALGIAIPLARVAGISIAGKKGLLVRNFAAFEMAKRITAIVFDKTGTVTHGNWTLQEIMAFAPFDETQALKLAAGLEKNSDHFIGREILRQARIKNIEPAKLHEIRAEENGVSGEFEAQVLKIGSHHFLGNIIDEFTKRLGAKHSDQDSKNSYIFMSSADQPAAIFIFGDTIRDGINATVQSLHHRGLQTALVSGDGPKTTGAVAKGIGIRDAYGGRMPQDKVAIVQALQDQNHRVAMVGDGINDAPALVQADLSMAVHSGAHLGEELADVTLMQAAPEQIIDFLEFANAVNTKIHQNLVFTFAYNVISIPLAMSGLLTPLVAVSAMLLSSISVIGNTIRLVRQNSE